LGIATHFKKPAQREQLATVLQQYQNLANRILTTVKPMAVYQKYVENLQQLTNCAMKN
jgi:hypothetical protein